ncbi:MAG TPA: OmpA family protein [Chitinophagaceae bacterium]|nr:OmpA family protein [Chitinophagaceae bacterium]
MQKFVKVLLIAAIILPGLLHAQDVEGSKDHPLITRYPGSTIGFYEEQQYITYSIATGPQTGYRFIKDWIKTEGRLTRIYYSVKGKTTVTEVYRNYLTALNKGSFKILAQGVDDKRNTSQQVGGRTFLGTFYGSNPFPTDKNILLSSGSATSGGSCYIAAHLKKPGTEVYVVVGGTQYSSDEKVFMVDILERTVMEDDLISTNAAEMLNGIKANGKIALYGIFFDFDKADVKPESKPALEEIAKLLRNNSSMNLYVVGHTDMQGTLSYNMSLSERRAKAIVDELAKNYSIAASRLTGAGVGPLAPVSTNKTDAGRKLNRRVELVEK